jgi:hypothetical protein
MRDKKKGNMKGVIMKNEIWALTTYNRYIIGNNFTFWFTCNQPIPVSGKDSYLLFLYFPICSAIKYFRNHVDKQACLHHTCQRKRKLKNDIFWVVAPCRSCENCWFGGMCHPPSSG